MVKIDTNSEEFLIELKKTKEFTDKYVEGYWEKLGYHPRGNVWLEERFKHTN